MFWRFVKFTRIFLRIRAGKNFIFRFMVLQGRDTIEEGIQQERKRRKMLMKRFQNELNHMEQLRANTSKMYRSFYSNAHQFEYNTDEAIHAIHLEKDTYVDDLETIMSDYDDMPNGPIEFHFLDQSFVEDV